MSQNNFIVNGRTVIHRQSGGYAMASSINFTGEEKIPIPYQVRAEAADLENLASGLMVNGEPCATIASYIKRCSGDEAGDGGGIFSKTIGGRCDFLTASSDTVVSDDSFMVNGKPLVREGDLLLLNYRNSAITTWCQSSGNPAEQTQKEQGSKESLPSPYQLSVAILGQTSDSGEQSLWINSAPELKAEHFLACDETGESAKDSDWRRLSFKNLEKGHQYFLHFSVRSEQGHSIMIPFPFEAQSAVLKEDDAAEIRCEQNLFIPFQLKHNLWQEEGAFHPTAGQYSDILFFHEELRQKIYSELLHYQLSAEERLDDRVGHGLDSFFKPRISGFQAEKSSLKAQDKSWYEILSSELKHQVDEAKNSAANEAHLRSGYIYIFLEGYLWREIMLGPQGQLLEIDLQQDAGKATRKATGAPCHQLYLPCRLGGKSVNIEIAYSDIQWSWARIQYFGGVNPEDFRFKDRPELKNKNHKAASRRKQRFTPLDLSLYLQDHPTVEERPQGYLLHHYQPEQQVASLYLEDSLLPICRALQDIDFLSSQLHQLIKAIHQLPYFLTGLTCYRYFFDEKSAHREPYSNEELARQRSKESYEMLGGKYDLAGLHPLQMQLARERFNKFAQERYPDENWKQGRLNEKLLQFQKHHFNDIRYSKYAQMKQEGKPNALMSEQKYLDKQKLEALLKVELRAKIRQMVILLQEQVAQLLSSDESERKTLPLTASLMLNPYEIFRDYFSQDPLRYVYAWSMLSAIFNRLGLNVSEMDNDLDINRMQDHLKPGQEFIKNILQDAHPLYPMIFASQQQIRAAQTFDPESAKAYFNDCSREDHGDFCGLKFAFAWHEQESLSMEKMLNPGLNILHEAVSGFALAILNGHIDRKDADFEKAKQFNFQLMQATGQPILSLITTEKELNLHQRGTELIGYNEAHQYGGENVYDFRQKPQSKTSNAKVKILKNGEAMVSFSTLEQDIDINASAARKALNDHLWKTAKAKANEPGYGFVLTETSYLIKEIEHFPLTQDSESRKKLREATFRYERVVDLKQGFFKKNALKIDKATTSILSVFAFMNLLTVQREVWKKNTGDMSSYRGSDLFTVYINLFFSLETLAMKFFPLDKLSNLYSIPLISYSISNKKFSFSVGAFISLLGISVHVLSISSTLSNTRRLLKQHDKKGVVLNSLITVSDVAGLLIFQGGRISDQLAAQARNLVKASQIPFEEAMTMVTEEWMAKQGVGAAFSRVLFGFSSSFMVVGLLIVIDFSLRALYEHFRDKPLTQWVKSSPFSCYENEVKKNDFDYVAEFMELLFCPQHQISPFHQSPIHGIQMEISFPLFQIGKHHLEFKAETGKNYYLFDHLNPSSTPYQRERVSQIEGRAKISEIHYKIKPGGLLDKLVMIFDGEGRYPHRFEYGICEHWLTCSYRLHLDNEVVLPIQRQHMHVLSAKEYTEKTHDEKDGWYNSEALVFTKK